MVQLNDNPSSMKNLLNFGKEFLEDADENDKKQYKKMMKSRVKMQKRIKKEQMLFGILPNDYLKTD